MNKKITKNIIIGVLGLLLGLSLCYIGYDKLISKNKVKEQENINNQEEISSEQIEEQENGEILNKNDSTNDTKKDFNCSMCYEEMSPESRNVMLYFHDNTKLFTLAFELNGLDTFDVTTATIDNYFPFIYTYIEQYGNKTDDVTRTIKEDELKEALEKYFDLEDASEIIEKAKTYTNEYLNKENSLYQFHYNDHIFTISYGPRGYDYSYRLYDYHYEDNDKVLDILKCNSMGSFNCKVAKKITLTRDTYKIKKIENY